MVRCLSLGVALAAQGCLLSEPPTYEARAKTRPYLIPVDPPPTRVLTVEPRGQIEFRAEVRSEDAGDDVYVFLYLDYTTPKEERIASGAQGIAASTLDEPCPAAGECRPARRTWIVADDTASGCHSVTLLATHGSNFPRGQQGCEKPTFPTERGEDGGLIRCFLSSADIGTLTWWVDVHEIGEPSASLDSCPTPAVGAVEGAQ